MAIIRMTKSVRRLLQVFEATDAALSVVELVARLREEMNKTTVYRILERLEDDGILHSYLGLDGLTWYAKCTGCTSSDHIDMHPHFQCTVCGKSECLSSEIALPQLPNHRIDTAQLLLVGLCAECTGRDS